MLSRSASVLPKSALVLAATAVVELVVFVLAATQLDVMLLILVVGALSAIGMVLLVRQTARAFRLSVDDVLAATSDAGRNLGDRGLKLAGAALLAFPGLITGAIGALLLLPPVRAVIRPLVGARLARFAPTGLDSPLGGLSFGDLSRSIRRQQAVDVESVRKGERSAEPRSSRPELG